MTGKSDFDRAIVWLTVSWLVAILVMVGVWVSRPGPTHSSGGKAIAAIKPADPLRCIQSVGFDEKNQPILTMRSMTTRELETRYHEAKQYLATAEQAGIWSDLGQRSARLATAALLEVLVCKP